MFEGQSLQEVGCCIVVAALPPIEAVVVEASIVAAIAEHFTRITATGSGFAQQLDQCSASDCRVAGLEDC